MDIEESMKQLEKLHANEVYLALETNTQGLNSEEVVKRQKEYGMNDISEKKGKPAILKLLANVTHLMAVLLWVGGIVAIIGGLPELAIAIWMVNIINGVFSFWQEHKAEKATEALKKLLPTYSHVIRDGQNKEVLADELVPGDVILLAQGDLISADARLVDDNGLRVNQSTLTGESNPIRKSKIEIHDEGITKVEQKNMVFAGTTVSVGNGKAVVYATGMRTEFGKIAGLTQDIKDEQSPLQKEMGKITRTVSIMSISIGFIFFLLSVFLLETALPLAIVFTLGKIVAFVPEGLLPTVTLSLVMGVQRMAKKNALIKRLSDVETLGCTSVICTDKTGTLTQNEMTASNIYINGRNLTITGVGYAADGDIVENDKVVEKDNRDLKELLIAAALCSNARLLPPKEDIKKWTVLGDPTEACILVAAGKYGIDLDKENTNIPRLREIPFDSSRKRMSTIHQLRGEKISYTKGAPKEVLEISKWIRIDGQDQPMTEEKFREIMEVNDNYARNGLRVLGVAVRKLTKELDLPKSMGDYTYQIIEQDLIFLGLVAMVDPPRVEVAEAIAKCRHAGIRIIMITGDYGLTAESIAKKIGIVESDKPRIITGIELETISDEELKIALMDEVIFARVAPEQKLRVVTILQEMDQVVAVTGDGVNDSPALKKADIGIAMGMTGTDVAKEAADMILTDDNFASIVNAVEEGRTVYNNIRKFTMYIFTSNVAQAVPLLFYLLSKGAIPLPLTIMQVFAIDLGTDIVPAIGLGIEAPETGIMFKPPRARNERLLSKKLKLKAFLWYGPIEAFAAMASFFFLYWLNGWRGGPMDKDGDVYAMATAMAFGAIVLVQIGNVFASRTDRMSVLKKGFFTNRLIIIGIVVELVLLALLLYVPLFNKVFNTAPIGLLEWGFLIIWAPLILILDEIRKMILRSRDKKKFNMVIESARR